MSDRLDRSVATLQDSSYFGCCCLGQSTRLFLGAGFIAVILFLSGDAVNDFIVPLCPDSSIDVCPSETVNFYCEAFDSLNVSSKAIMWAINGHTDAIAKFDNITITGNSSLSVIVQAENDGLLITCTMLTANEDTDTKGCQLNVLNITQTVTDLNIHVDSEYLTITFNKSLCSPNMTYKIIISNRDSVSIYNTSETSITVPGCFCLSFNVMIDTVDQESFDTISVSVPIEVPKLKLNVERPVLLKKIQQNECYLEIEVSTGTSCPIEIDLAISGTFTINNTVITITNTSSMKYIKIPCDLVENSSILIKIFLYDKLEINVIDGNISYDTPLSFSYGVLDLKCVLNGSSNNCLNNGSETVIIIKEEQYITVHSKDGKSSVLIYSRVQNESVSSFDLPSSGTTNQSITSATISRDVLGNFTDGSIPSQDIKGNILIVLVVLIMVITVLLIVILVIGCLIVNVRKRRKENQNGLYDVASKGHSISQEEKSEANTDIMTSTETASLDKKSEIITHQRSSNRLTELVNSGDQDSGIHTDESTQDLSFVY